MLGNLQLATSLALIVKWEDLQNVIVSTLVFVIIGLIIFALAFFFITMVTPFSVRKEIEEDQNMALAIVIGAIFISISIIIAAAISG
ncbi:MAG TPA: DUF350 domain-containing protein [Pyrinomonadaceae bacterium]|jgi:uncharacterized membrane protein YjfL (UPF0719 family)|nr:DUF350 domain-containing protein [Pyrinomonadaceae bacterium]